MVKWLTSYLEENRETWERSKLEREIEQKETLMEWENISRLQKIKILK